MNQFQIILELEKWLKSMSNYVDKQYGKEDIKALRDRILLSLLSRHECCVLEYMRNVSIVPVIKGYELHAVYLSNGRVLEDLVGTRIDFGEPVVGLALYKQA
jgi:hypothetical protein